MGFFGLFSRKPNKVDAPEPEPAVVAPQKAPPTPPPGLSPWQLRLWEAEHDPAFAWEENNSAARSLVRSLLFQAARKFGDGTVVNAEPTPYATTGSLLISRFGGGAVHVEDNNPELHGVWDGRPVRIPVSLGAQKFWAIEMRCEEQVRWFTAIRDLERVPRPSAPNDPWAKSTQECVFVGKGIFLDDIDTITREWAIPEWARVPAAAQELVVREMERLDLRVFKLANADHSVIALGNRTLREIEDPIAYLESCATFLAEFVKALAASSADDASKSSAAEPQRTTCKYCRSIFIFSVGKTACPNCGAPASAG
jgi:hypothetical protein